MQPRPFSNLDTGLQIPLFFFTCSFWTGSRRRQDICSMYTLEIMWAFGSANAFLKNTWLLRIRDRYMGCIKRYLCSSWVHYWAFSVTSPLPWVFSVTAKKSCWTTVVILGGTTQQGSLTALVMSCSTIWKVIPDMIVWSFPQSTFHLLSFFFNLAHHRSRVSLLGFLDITGVSNAGEWASVVKFMQKR